MGIVRSGSPRGRIEYLLRQAAEDWVDLNFDGPGLLGRASTDNEFLKMAESQYYQVLIESEWFPDPPAASPDPRRLVVDLLYSDQVPERGENTVYYHIGDNDEVIYIGKSVDFMQRQRQHRSQSYWWQEIKLIKWCSLKSNEEMSEYEICEIRSFNPVYNIAHKGI